MISKQTFDFLTELKKHNNKEWFERNKGEFREVYAHFSEFINELAKEVAKFDSRVKKSLIDKRTVKVFRIYRDARFSNNKQPYKLNFGGTIAPHGMENGNAGYYVHVEPGNSFLAGGIHMPDPKVLAKVRSAIAKDHKILRRILGTASFRKTFGRLDPYAMVKTRPKGFAKDHPAIDLLRYKSFIALKKISDKEVTSKNFQREAVKTLQILKPLNDYLAEAVGK